MQRIPCLYFRGGTSKGPCFLKSDLPIDINLRNTALLKIMGSPHPRQVDGIGGADSLASKVVVVAKSTRANVDIDYLLCQVHINESIVETSLNCGNMLATVAPFAIEKGLITTTHPETTITIFNENTHVIMQATVQTPNGKLTYLGNQTIAGVPGTGATIKLTFLNPVGAKTKKLLPTDQLIDVIDDIPVSCVDVAVPMVIVAAASLQKTGCESKQALDADNNFMRKLEIIRRKAAIKMGLGDVTRAINPKICMVARSCNHTITSRYFTPFDCHRAHAVSGGLCLAAATLLAGSVPHQVANIKTTNTNEHIITIEHPSGELQTHITMEKTAAGITFPQASFIRTARLLFAGEVYY